MQNQSGGSILKTAVGLDLLEPRRGQCQVHSGGHEVKINEEEHKKERRERMID